jgi:hypothetical protein
MGDVIVIQFATLDGVVSDPDGRWGTGHGGWAFRYGTGPVRDDKFRLGTRMAQGVQLYGRRTWEHFARLWPGRDDGGLSNGSLTRRLRHRDRCRSQSLLRLIVSGGKAGGTLHTEAGRSTYTGADRHYAPDVSDDPPGAG